MALEIVLTQEDVEGLQDKLSNKKAIMTMEEIKFTEYLIARATRGRESSDLAGSKAPNDD